MNQYNVIIRESSLNEVLYRIIDGTIKIQLIELISSGSFFFYKITYLSHIEQYIGEQIT